MLVVVESAFDSLPIEIGQHFVINGYMKLIVEKLLDSTIDGLIKREHIICRLEINSL